MTDSSQPPQREQRPKSLWEVMSHGAAPSDQDPHETQPPSSQPQTSQEPSEPAAPLKSLWDIMGDRPPEISPEEITKETVASPLRDEETAALDMITDDAAFDKDVETKPTRKHSRVKPPVKSPPEPKRWRKTSEADQDLKIEIRTAKREPAAPKQSKKAKWSVVLACLAILLSILAVLPNIWSKFPALLIGFWALFCGFLAADEIRTSRGRQTGMNQALLGMGLSLLGMFLGPILAWGLGGWDVLQNNRQITKDRLSQIGTALDDHYDERRQFPAGGVFDQQRDGSFKPLHGWMTALLPYLGHQQVHNSINLFVPFDDPENVDAMQTQIPEFLVAGVDKTTSIKQFAAAHFAGVGGEETDPQGRKIHFGIFDRNSAVKYQDVSDGLSNTLVAGEIPSNFPAWGEPQNWRKIGDGLNREQRGFGSVGGGATWFLMGDGSVRQLSSDTDPQILRKMSTRNGGE